MSNRVMDLGIKTRASLALAPQEYKDPEFGRKFAVCIKVHNPDIVSSSGCCCELTVQNDNSVFSLGQLSDL
jgi:hypothetical protein